MSAMLCWMRDSRRDRVTAAELTPGVEVFFEEQSGLVARVVVSREDVMVELWSRGGFEHRAHFLDPAQVVEMAVG